MAVLYQINCGNTYPAAGWADDAPYVVQGSNVYSVATTQNVTNVDCPGDILKDHRWAGSGEDPLTYEFDVTGYSDVKVTLYWSEVYYSASGYRYFDVAIEGTQVENNYDVYVQAGGQHIGVQEVYEHVAVSGTTLSITVTRQVAAPMLSGIKIESYDPVEVTAALLELDVELPAATVEVAGVEITAAVLDVEIELPAATVAVTPVAAQGTYSDMDITATVGGVDVSAYIDPDRFAIQSVLARATDSAKFWLRDAGALGLAEWDEVIIQDGTPRIFGGYVTHLTDSAGSDGGLNIGVTASDYGVLVSKAKNIKEEFEAQTDAAIIAALFAEYLPEIDATTYVEELVTHTRIRFNRMALDAILDQLAEAAGASWYVDYDQYLHYYTAEALAAPYSLSDTPDYVTAFPFEALARETEGADIVNRVEVVGGSYLSEDATFYLPGTGEDTRVTLPFKLHAPDGQAVIQVWRNDGTAGTPSWTALTVKAGYLDELSAADDVLYYYSEAVLEQASNWPDLPNAVKVTGRYDVPLRTRVRDNSSYALYGRWFDDALIDESIVDKATARLAGKGFLAQRALGKVSLTCDCREPGLRSGMAMPLIDHLRGLDDSYLIQTCTATIGIGGDVVYSLGMGAHDPDLIDVLVRIARQSEPSIAWREDEVLDDIYAATESLSLAEATDVTTTQPPYLWGSFKWGFGKWSS